MGWHAVNGSCRFAAIFRALNVRAQVSALYWRSSDPSPRPSVMQKVRATAWDAEEIAKLTQKVEANDGVGNMETMRRIESEMPGRTARQLYDRWRSNAVNKRDFSTGWSEADDQQLLTRATVAGWTDITKEFDGTSAADVNNRWRYLMRQPVAPGGRSWDAGEAELREKVLSEHHASLEETARKRRATKPDFGGRLPTLESGPLRAQRGRACSLRVPLGHAWLKVKRRSPLRSRPTGRPRRTLARPQRRQLRRLLRMMP